MEGFLQGMVRLAMMEILTTEMAAPALAQLSTCTPALRKIGCSRSANRLPAVTVYSTQMKNVMILTSIITMAALSA